MHRFFASLACGLLLFPISVSSQAKPEDCEIKGTNEMVTAVLCPVGLDQVALQKAGTLACGERTPCGAWIWEDESAIPETIPNAHDLLPQSSVRAAKAVWMNEVSQLIILEKQ